MASAPLFATLLGIAAPQPGYGLEWDAPPGCPGADDVRRAIDRSLGPGVVSDGKTDARIRIISIESGYRMDLILAGPSAGERTLEASDCRDLADAAALIVAIAVDPNVLTRSPAPRVQPTSNAVPAPAETSPGPAPEDAPTGSEVEPDGAPPSSADPTGSAAPQAERRRAQLSLRLAAGAGFALVPGVTGALELGVGLAGRAWRVDLGLNYWIPKRADAGSDADAGGRFQIAAASLRGCGVPQAGPVRFPLCAGLDVGTMIGRGTGQDVAARTAAQPWVAVRAGPAVRWRVIPRLTLWLGGDVLVPLVRPRFHTDATPDLFVVPPVGGSVVAGVDIPLG